MSFLGAVFAQARVVSDDATTHWLSIVLLVSGVLGILGMIWAKGVRPMMKAIGKLLEEREWVREQLKPNGKARFAGTDDLSLRDALDVNTAATKALETHVAELGAKLSQQRDDVTDVEQRQRDAIAWGLRTMTEFRERLDAMDHRDTRPPRLEPEGDDK